MRTCCVSDKNACKGISYIRFCFYFIGNTVIHSCVKVELSYESFRENILIHFQKFTNLLMTK